MQPQTVAVPFTQFLRPDGRRQEVRIERPADVGAKALSIIAAGFRFECEELTTGQVSLTIADDDGDYAFEIIRNGPDVPAAVDKLVMGFDPAVAKSGEAA